jgi:cephalosporin-C deacetylase-like acetyl esterase
VVARNDDNLAPEVTSMFGSSIRYQTALTVCIAGLISSPAALAQSAPLDLWSPAVIAKIKDGSTLNMTWVQQDKYLDVYFDSEIGEAKWADSEAPFEVHTGDTIRIHGYLAFPPQGSGPFPAVVIGHGHGGSGSADLARAVAAFGYAAFAIDGPRSGQSVGGPEDTNQAWISVEEVMNVPAPEVSYLYHYAYAGMRAITALEQLAATQPFPIDPTKIGVVGASMGGQFTYYINGVDDRVKAAVAIAAAGDWRHTIAYEGAWLYHGLYYYTRDGIASGTDALNTVADVCTDPTLQTFLDYFDPANYAPHQHAPILTIIGTHDQYFTAPAINTTYDRTATAGTNPRFMKRIMLAPNGKHAVVDNPDPLATILAVMGDITGWFDYSFDAGGVPLETPSVAMVLRGDVLVFRASALAGSDSIRRMDLSFATQMDSTLVTPCDFRSIRMFQFGADYFGFVPVGTAMSCGPSVTPANILYFATGRDRGGATISSKLYRGSTELQFCSDFVPRIEHFPGDDFPVPPPPGCTCSTPAIESRSGQGF